MKYFKSLGLCLVAVFALGAVVAGTASAKTVTLLFKEGGKKPNFSSVVSEEGFLVQKSGAEVKCTSARNSGEAVPGTDSARNIRILFSGCTFKEIPCKSTGQPSGSIQTFPLQADYGDIEEGSGTKLIVGYVLKAEVNATTNPNTLFAEFECGAAGKVKVRGKERGTSGEKGGIIGEILPLGPTHEPQVNRLIDKGTPILVTYRKGKEKFEQGRQTLTTLGSTISELLLESSSGGSGFELAAIEQKGDTELFFLESVEISCFG